MVDLVDVDRSFAWLGRFPLAVDLADTVRVVSAQDVELLHDDHALDVWIAAESPRYPSAQAARGRLDEVCELRDVVRELLDAHTRGASLPEHELEAINELSERSPSFPVLSFHGDREVVEVNNDDFEVFTADVARSLIAVISEDPQGTGRCEAPRCGMFFVMTSQRQRWCSPACGNRARVARHAERVGRR